MKISYKGDELGFDIHLTADEALVVANVLSHRIGEDHPSDKEFITPVLMNARGKFDSHQAAQYVDKSVRFELLFR